jgi:ligand-binding sensor domain-containing protein
MRHLATPLIASLGLGACFDSAGSGSTTPPPPPPPPVCEPTEVAPPRVAVAWETREVPGLLTWMVELPPGTSPFERGPVITLEDAPEWPSEGYGVSRVSLVDADGTTLETVDGCPSLATENAPAPCVRAAPIFFRQPVPGHRLEVEVVWVPSPNEPCHTPTVDATTVTVDLGPDPEPGAAIPAVATFGDEKGTLWLGTLNQGLVGVGANGSIVRYAGVPFNEPWSDTHQAPQTELLFDIEDAGDGALWIGGATTGVSWFDPGPDLLSRDDDRWAHVQPQTAPDSPLKELAETTVALAPTPDGGLWVASLSGLHLADADDTALRLETLAPGAFVAVAADAAGTAWAGRSVEPAVLDAWQEGAAGDPWPDAALLEVQRNEARELTVRPWALGVTAVTAVAVQGGRVWVGTPTGLLTVRPDAPEADPEPVLPQVLGGLAVTGLAVDDDGVWVAARSECDVTRGELLKVVPGEDGTPVIDTRLSELGFATRDFNSVTRLPGGALIVSTVVPSARFVSGGPIISANCTPPTAEARAGAGVWRVDLAASPPTARPLDME